MNIRVKEVYFMKLRQIISHTYYSVIRKPMIHIDVFQENLWGPFCNDYLVSCDDMCNLHNLRQKIMNEICEGWLANFMQEVLTSKITDTVFYGNLVDDSIIHAYLKRTIFFLDDDSPWVKPINGTKMAVVHLLGTWFHNYGWYSGTICTFLIWKTQILKDHYKNNKDVHSSFQAIWNIILYLSS